MLYVCAAARDMNWEWGCAAEGISLPWKCCWCQEVHNKSCSRRVSGRRRQGTAGCIRPQLKRLVINKLEKTQRNLFFLSSAFDIFFQIKLAECFSKGFLKGCLQRAGRTHFALCFWWLHRLKDEKKKASLNCHHCAQNTVI